MHLCHARHYLQEDMRIIGKEEEENFNSLSSVNQTKFTIKAGLAIQLQLVKILYKLIII